jgi:hypothetical protein
MTIVAILARIIEETAYSHSMSSLALLVDDPASQPGVNGSSIGKATTCSGAARMPIRSPMP